MTSIEWVTLYHGTSEAAARAILTEGIVARGDAPSHWDVASRDDLVYLSSCYAPYFAGHAYEPPNFALVEVRVPTVVLYPDEDFLEQATRGVSDLPWNPSGDIATRTLWFRERLEEFQHYALDALSALGNVATSHVPVEHVQRVALVPAKVVPRLTHRCMDPSITLANHTLFGETYAALTRAFFGDAIQPEALFLQGSYEHIPREYRNALARELQSLPSIVERLEADAALLTTRNEPLV